MTKEIWITSDIACVQIPFEDVYTTVTVVRTDAGVLLFDAATTDADVEEAILPALHRLGIAPDAARFLFLSHLHGDHAGGAPRLLRALPQLTVVSRAADVAERFAPYATLCPRDGELLLGCLRVVAIPGHTLDSAALLDLRTGTLISGDCLQLYGLFGAGTWGANIRFPVDHLQALTRLRADLPQRILAAHAYAPLGALYEGEEMILRALDACMLPLRDLRELIERYPAEDDAALALRYNAMEGRPPLTRGVVASVRAAMRDERFWELL